MECFDSIEMGGGGRALLAADNLINRSSGNNEYIFELIHEYLDVIT